MLPSDHRMALTSGRQQGVWPPMTGERRPRPGSIRALQESFQQALLLARWRQPPAGGRAPPGPRAQPWASPRGSGELSGNKPACGAARSRRLGLAKKLRAGAAKLLGPLQAILSRRFLSMTRACASVRKLAFGHFAPKFSFHHMKNQHFVKIWGVADVTAHAFSTFERAKRARQARTRCQHFCCRHTLSTSTLCFC